MRASLAAIRNALSDYFDFRIAAFMSMNRIVFVPRDVLSTVGNKHALQHGRHG